jgi:hypothetical protein
MKLRDKNLLMALAIGALAVALYLFAVYHVISGTPQL